MSRFDIVGADELLLAGDEDYLLGADDDDIDAMLSGYDIVGARFPLRRGGGRGMGRVNPAARALAARNQNAYRMALAQATAQKQANNGLLIRSQEPTKARRLVLPIESTGTVAAGAAATITARPQTIAFKPQRIVVPSTVAPDFIITDIKVGVKSQLVASGNLPAEAFIPTLFDGEMEMDTVQTSQDFVIQVQNISGAARTFRAAIYGKSAD